ncbi:uncharacterized protein K460DRAFT_378961 [Cucurbitaria berberidis CBS 394.84]|uniref:Uncharacterized protein n=1 Tax=Cucurbitaria berberidis CBS 394.84 TaxID=1168544 RepID=A0A9P4GDI0_9PLEO|nr:uncharacterized protein K460DRAFT_378961 [Cucurbitaria berberidis CBS 394.84]KAF1843928.1 hypothetical protein K460DRAFT_378961 [Cucurbitaria berberidis CBS 394.84]
MSFLSSITQFLPSFDRLRGQPQPAAPFTTPTYEDVCRARALLKALHLPTELVLDILDYASYWPTYTLKSSFDRIQATAPRAALCLEVGVFNNPTVNSIRASGERFKIRAVQFDIISNDQGWVSSNNLAHTYDTYSWLEVSILRNETNRSIHIPDLGLMDPLVCNPLGFHRHMAGRGCFLVSRPEDAFQGPQDGEGDLAWYLQGNRVTASRQRYHVVWAEDGSGGNSEGAGTGKGFLQALTDGDRILVWARAKYPGWECIVKRLTVTVCYGF